jgi:hypothetical protein
LYIFSIKSREKLTTKILQTKKASLISNIPEARLIIEFRICKESERFGFRKNIQAKKTALCVKNHPNGAVSIASF